MHDFLFSSNAVLPTVIFIAMGWGIRKLGWISEKFVLDCERLCFRFLLPLMLSVNVYKSESIRCIDWRFTLFCSGMIVAAFFAGLLYVQHRVPRLNQKAVMLQCIFRSNFSVIGISLSASLYGNEAMQATAMISLFSIPLFNALAVLSLRMFQKNSSEKTDVKSCFIDILQNPLIIGILIGMGLLLIRLAFESLNIAFRLSDINFLYNALTQTASVTTPLMLMTLGMGFHFQFSKPLLRSVLQGCVARLLLVPLAALLCAFLLYKDMGPAQYATLIALFGTPTPVSMVVMAKQMGADSALAEQLVVWTTVLSTFTLFAFVLCVRWLGIL